MLFVKYSRSQRQIWAVAHIESVKIEQESTRTFMDLVGVEQDPTAKISIWFFHIT